MSEFVRDGPPACRRDATAASEAPASLPSPQGSGCSGRSRRRRARSTPRAAQSTSLTRGEEQIHGKLDSVLEMLAGLFRAVEGDIGLITLSNVFGEIRGCGVAGWFGLCASYLKVLQSVLKALNNEPDVIHVAIKEARFLETSPVLVSPLENDWTCQT